MSMRSRFIRISLVSLAVTNALGGGYASAASIDVNGTPVADGGGATGNVTITASGGTANTIILSGSRTTIDNATTITSGGLSVTGSINNNNGGITNAGAISGATTITGSGNATLGTAAATTNTLGNGANSTNTIGGGASSTNTIGNAGTSNNLVNGTANTLTGSTTNTIQTGAAATANRLVVDTSKVSLTANAAASQSSVAADGMAVTMLAGKNSAVLDNVNGLTVIGVSHMVIGTTNVVSGNGRSVLSVNDGAVNVVGDTASLAGRNSTVVSGGATSMTLSTAGVNLANAFGGVARLSGVANGINPNDAVNLSQLTAASNRLNNKITDVQDKAYAGVASAVAMSQIPEPRAGHHFSVGVGYGNYANKNAVAIGGKANLADNFRVTMGMSASDDDVAVGAGFGYSW